MRRRRIVAGVAAFLAAAGVGYCTGPATVERDMGVLEESTCWEDEPCFNCLTMGNGDCGDPGPEPVELHRTGIWWPCWAVDQPCEDEG